MEVAYGEQIISTDDIERDHSFKISEKDNINPDHYKNQTSLECIEAMSLMFGDEAVINFCKCNAFKYIWRWKNKNGQEDLEKALWYIRRAEHIIERYGGYEEEKTPLIRMEDYIICHRK